MKKIRYAIEAFFLYLLMAIFSIMPVGLASGTGGLIGKVIGPRLAASRKALRNLKNALPAKSEEEYQQIIQDMWENLGRIMAEYPHLETIARKRTVVEIPHEVEEIIQTTKHSILFIGGHIGNWEVNGAAALEQNYIHTTYLYRPPNNPPVDRLLDHYRSLKGKLSGIPKAKSGTRSIVRLLKEGKHLGILIDQKYNEGIAVPFFHRPAMTSPVFVSFAQSYGAHLIPCRSERLNHGPNFKLTLYPPIPALNEDGEKRPIEDVVNDTHRLLEGWITERPDQWLWLHRRWDSASLKQEKVDENDSTAL